ncbi:CCSAP protein, partial [Polyodon spathula]|nr:CCSAP protein [Polyodon spathula]
MKKFKDPKWDTYSKCYEDMLKYRLTRRLLEQAHNPWMWEGWENSSDSSGKSTPQNGKKIEPLKEEATKETEKKLTELPESETTPKEVLESKVSNGKERDELQQEDNASEISHATGKVSVIEGQATGEDRKTAEMKKKERSQEQDQSGSVSACARSSHKSTKSKSQQPDPAETDKENKHPFALYGWAEKTCETGHKKTHNVCPSASTKEIHASALRAKTRREIEKRMKTERRRARSAELEKAQRDKSPPADNPWVTEYMRCFSARTR